MLWTPAILVKFSFLMIINREFSPPLLSDAQEFKPFRCQKMGASSEWHQGLEEQS